MDVHQLKWNNQSPREIQFKTVSCYACECKEECPHFKLKNSPFIFANAVEEAEKDAGTKKPKSGSKAPVKGSPSGIPSANSEIG